MDFNQNDVAIVERLHDMLLDNSVITLNDKLSKEARDLAIRIQKYINNNEPV